MSTVYLAYDPQVKRDVAIKLLTGQLLYDPEARALFEDEAERIASLEHPAIVPVYDFGKHEEQPFIVMRYMPGGSLFDRLREAGGAGLPMADVAEILLRVSDALLVLRRTLSLGEVRQVQKIVSGVGTAGTVVAAYGGLR